jgi:hypothetical protein
VFAAGFVWLAVLAGAGAVGYLIGRSKGRPGAGLVLGLLLGIIGWVVIALLPAAPGYGTSGWGGAAPENDAAGWKRDPFGRHGLRYWSGHQWTEHVANEGIQGTDPPTAPPPSAGI